MRGRPCKQGGFSLAETLVALLILALVSAAGTSLLMGATSTTKQIKAREAETRTLDLAQALIRNDIAALSVRAVIPESGYGGAGNLFGQSRDESGAVLSFVRSGWINPQGAEPRGTLQHVSYRLESGALIRSVSTRPDAVRATPVAERVLFENISRIELGFWRGGARSREWIGDAGQALHILPDLIDVEIVFDDDRRLQLAVMTGARL